MNTQNQFAVFALCIVVGFLGGVLYEPFAFCNILLGERKGKNKILCGFLDVTFFVFFAVLSVFAAYFFRFPDFRVYMWLGFAVGGILYFKTLHEIVAFFEKICYNSITKLLKKAKKREKTLSKREDNVL